MSTVIDATVAEIDRTLEAAKAEIAKLEGARQALAGQPRQAPQGRAQTPRRRRAPSRSPQGTSVRRGQRRAEFLEAVERNPGITTTEVARKLQVRRGNARRVAAALVEGKRIHGNDEGGWFPQPKTKGRS